MGLSRTWWLVAPLVALSPLPLLVERTALGADAGAALPADAVSADASAAPPACGDGRRLLEEYASLYAGVPTEAGVEAARHRFRHLIALIPDPVESEHTDYYDSVLEGVEEAVARGKDGAFYVRDRSWLPWPGSDQGKRNFACWEKKPGVVLYRPTAKPDQTPAFVVLLVGETPTWGLRREQFESALALADEFSFPREDGTREYKILGPTFSGTAASLEAVLRLRLFGAGVNGPPPRHEPRRQGSG